MKEKENGGKCTPEENAVIGKSSLGF